MEKICLYLLDLLFNIKNKWLTPSIRGQKGSEAFHYNPLLRNNLLLILEANMFISRLPTCIVSYFTRVLRNKGFNGPERIFFKLSTCNLIIFKDVLGLLITNEFVEFIMLNSNQKSVL